MDSVCDLESTLRRTEGLSKIEVTCFSFLLDLAVCQCVSSVYLYTSDRQTFFLKDKVKEIGLIAAGLAA